VPARFVESHRFRLVRSPTNRDDSVLHSDERAASVDDVTFDFDEVKQVPPGHYAFLVSESRFDEIFGRIRERGLAYWADPFQQKPGAINRNDGGRGVYFKDPSGHLLEIITRPYGSGERNARTP
jgi:catechol 2,3-dioxygenase-like lactoylglutathione lyase family enzyme